MLVDVEIVGMTSLLQHRFTGEEAEAGKKATRKMMVVEQLPRDVAEKAAYRMPGTGELYFPGAAIARLIRESGSNHKAKGSRKSVKFIIPAAVVVLDDAILLRKPGALDTVLKDFEVDSRPIVIPATRGRVMRHRPRIDAWAARFVLDVRDDVLPPEVIQTLLVEGGQRVGIGDFRPEKGGPFGTFRVTKWKERVEIKKPAMAS